jgi:hypothetical protein
MDDNCGYLCCLQEQMINNDPRNVKISVVVSRLNLIHLHFSPLMYQLEKFCMMNLTMMCYVEIWKHV